MRRIITVAVTGSSASWPPRVWPLVTVSRFVPSWSISESSADWLDLVMPSTATSAAIPMAMPSADRAALARR